MKFRQKIVLFLVIVVVDLILCGVTLRMWKGEGVEKDFKGDVYHERNKEERESGEQEKRNGRKEREVAAGKSDMVREKETDMRKYVALTFDDGPNSRYTKPLLDGLREREIRASFFLVGECIDGKEDLVKQMAEDGHLIGVHCMTHKDLTKEPLSDAKKEICETGEKIRAVTGVMPEYVRPPYGSWNAKLEEAVDMIPVFWDVDSIDWRLKNTEKVTAKVLKDTEDGDIILMHDEFRTSVEAALRIIDNLTAKGYTFVTVDELMVD